MYSILGIDAVQTVRNERSTLDLDSKRPNLSLENLKIS